MSANNNLVQAMLIVVIAGLISGCEGVQIIEVSGVPYKKNTKHEYTIKGETYKVLPSSNDYLEIGVASWYGKKFHGRLTANGEVYDMYQMSAAHKSLPLPTWVKVTNLDNGKKVILRVNDRGPFHDNRLIDLSYQAALSLDFADEGTAPVVVEALSDYGLSRTGLSRTGLSRTGLSRPGLNETGHSMTVSSISDNPKGDSGSYYLQIGAFARLQSAEFLMDKIDLLIGKHEVVDVRVRILQSEVEQKILHKVWIGPIRDESKRDMLALWVQEMDLGYPIKVDVD